MNCSSRRVFLNGSRGLGVGVWVRGWAIGSYIFVLVCGVLHNQENKNCGHYWVGNSDKVGFKINLIFIRLEIIL